MPQHFAISDIHGCCETFLALLAKLELVAGDTLFLLGDYIDRGMQSKQVIDHIWKLQAAGIQVHCLRGNHEQLLLDSILERKNNKKEGKTDESKFQHWFTRCGGLETMMSFDCHHPLEIPLKYRRFFEQLPFHLSYKNYLFVHAGLSFRLHPQKPLDDTHALIWERYWYGELDYKWLGERILVHGHTTITRAEILKRLEAMPQKQFLNIDNGCYRKKKIGMGRLCAFDLDKRSLHFQLNVDE